LPKKVEGERGHEDTENAERNALTSRIIGCAIAVHRTLGPGLLEAIYETALCIELDEAGIPYVRKMRVPAYYKGRLLGEYRVDLVIADAVLVEVKCVERLHPVLEAQLLTYLRVTKKRLGLLINFNSSVLKEGITRRML